MSRSRHRRTGSSNALGVATVVASACLPTAPPQSPQATAAMSHEIFQNEINLAREALARQEWVAAREHMDGVVEALPPSDPLGAEARAGLAQIAFELGDYTRAAQAAAEVPSDSPFASSALESRGLAQLFTCDFDTATQTFYQLAQVDPPRGRVWLGVTYAWTGADANAQRELTTVTDQYGASEHGPNARFYLAQLALWGRHPGPAQRYLGQLSASSPQYLQTLDQRAQNWLGRHTHLMRAYFTFDTLSRLDRISHNPNAEADDHNADLALQSLQQTPGACSEQVQRLAAARASTLADREAYASATRDTDGDGIPDSADRCPTQPETRNGIQDEDGCPESTSAIELDGNQIRIRQGYSINFAPGQDAVTDDSHAVIDQLAVLLASPQYAWIHRIRLDGHTDNVGSPSANVTLSEHRVHRVGAMLVSRGVDAARLSFGYYGGSRPIDPGTTEEARARNRRVEIFIVDPPMFGGVRASR